MYITVRGNLYPCDIIVNPDLGQSVAARLDPGDFALLSKNRVVNLQKIFPYIPTALNNIFLHFSLGTEVFYDTVDELYADLAEVAGKGW